MVGTADQAMLDDKCVVVVDDDPAMRLLATRIIGSRSDKFRVVGQAADGQAAMVCPDLTSSTRFGPTSAASSSCSGQSFPNMSWRRSDTTRGCRPSPRI